MIGLNIVKVPFQFIYAKEKETKHLYGINFKNLRVAAFFVLNVYSFQLFFLYLQTSVKYFLYIA